MRFLQKTTSFPTTETLCLGQLTKITKFQAQRQLWTWMFSTTSPGHRISSLPNNRLWISLSNYYPNQRAVLSTCNSSTCDTRAFSKLFLTRQPTILTLMTTLIRFKKALFLQIACNLVWFRPLLSAFWYFVFLCSFVWTISSTRLSCSSGTWTPTKLKRKSQTAKFSCKSFSRTVTPSSWPSRRKIMKWSSTAHLQQMMSTCQNWGPHRMDSECSTITMTRVNKWLEKLKSMMEDPEEIVSYKAHKR